MHRIAPLCLAVLLSGCGAIGAIDLPPFSLGKHGPDVAAVPSNAVQQSALPPVGDSPDPGAGGNGNSNSDTAGGDALPPDQNPTAGTNTALNGPSSPSTASVTGDIGRSDLLGGWTVASGTESCQLFMTLTSWTGGYRASTRGCSSDLLKGISAWNLNGKEVVLAGDKGKPVAHLVSSDMNHFNGQIDGQPAPITFYR